MSRLTSRAARRVVFPALFVLSTGLTGCAVHSGGPDALVARVVEREERRQAQRAAVAAVDLDPLELSSAGLILETLSLLYVPEARQASAEMPGSAPGWHYSPPTAWMAYPFPLALTWDVSPEQNAFASGDGDGKSDDGPASDGVVTQDSNGRPRVRLNFLKFRINNRPISFSGSAKGLKGVQLRATIKL
jgi:hypothetical protein